MSVINTNIKALVAQESITKNNRTLSTAMERLSTGSRINSAKDDAAGLAISTRMDSQVRGLSMAIRNANDGISLMQTAEGAMDEVTAILQRMRELAVQAVNGTNNDSDRVALNDEVVQLKAEIDRIAATTEFNSQKILDGSFKDKLLQIGDKAYQTMDVEIASVAAKDLGMESGSFDDNTLVGARLGTLANFSEGDIVINGQELAEFSATDNLEGLLRNINQSIDNVTATAFNTVVAKQIGTGIVSTEGDFKIKVTGPGTNAATEYTIAKSSSLEEMVDNINRQAGAQVEASINDDGKLVLSNTTGATISVFDKTGVAGSFETASGFEDEATGGAYVDFTGFLKLDSKDGSPIRIERGNLAATSPGTLADLEVLGFREVTSMTSKALDAYTLTGEALTAVTGEWGETDLKINGVRIWDEDIDTDSFQGKLDTINNFSEETGVIAYAYLDHTITFTAASFETSGGPAGLTAGATISFNGTLVFTAAAGLDMADLEDGINAKTATTGITAEFDGFNLRLTGTNVQSLKIDIAKNTGSSGAFAGLTDETVVYAGIRLDSVENRPISIELGESALVAEHGFLEANVGAADFQVNAAQFGVAAGGSLQGLNVSSQTSATKAISVIDNAIEQVSSSRSKLGAMQNRLINTVSNLTNVVTNTAASRSRIQDTDYAQETTKLAKAQIIQQAATAMLAQANQQPQSVLSLLQ
jgi:flagellin